MRALALCMLMPLAHRYVLPGARVMVCVCVWCLRFPVVRHIFAGPVRQALTPTSVRPRHRHRHCPAAGCRCDIRLRARRPAVSPGGCSFLAPPTTLHGVTLRLGRAQPHSRLPKARADQGTGGRKCVAGPWRMQAEDAQGRVPPPPPRDAGSSAASGGKHVNGAGWSRPTDVTGKGSGQLGPTAQDMARRERQLGMGGLRKLPRVYPADEILNRFV